ncbi:hypothetical protein ScPMuIL_003278 [Solemya velum]
MEPRHSLAWMLVLLWGLGILKGYRITSELQFSKELVVWFCRVQKQHTYQFYRENILSFMRVSGNLGMALKVMEPRHSLAWMLVLLWGLGILKANGPPSIELTLASPPVLRQDVSLRCVTVNLQRATVEFHQNGDLMAKVSHPCEVTLEVEWIDVTCSEGGTKSLYTLTTNSFSKSDFGQWSCQYYAGRATYDLSIDQAMSRHMGYVLRHVAENVTLEWPPMLPDVQPQGTDAILLDPGGSKLLVANFKNDMFHWENSSSRGMDFTGNLPQGILSVTWHMVEKVDNGTYLVVYGDQRIGITLVAIEKPGLPVITEMGRNKASGLATVTVKCSSVSRSGAPSYYKPEIKYFWNHPGHQHYTTSQNDSLLTISNIDCKSNTSLPVLCYAVESTSDSSPKQHYYPHTACRDTVTPVPPSGEEGTSEEYTRLVISLSVCMVLLFLAIIYIYLGRRRVGKCCSRTFKLLASCCSGMVELCGHLPCCKRCCKCCCKCLKSEDRWEDDFDIGRLHGSLRRDRIPVNFSNLGLSESETVEEPGGATGNTDNEEFENVPVVRQSVANDLDSAVAALRTTLTDATITISVRRSEVLVDLMAYYEDPEIVGKSVTVEYIGEEGFDLGGVTADMFTTFWARAASVYFHGNEALVPFLPPHRLEEEPNYVLLGRVYTHSTAVLGYVPVQLCRSTVMVLVYNDTNVSEDVLLEDLLLYLDEIDKELIVAGLGDFSSLSERMLEDLQDLFIRFEMGCVLKEDTFRSQVVNMARNELCIKPRSLCEWMRRGIPDGHIQYFWFRLTVDELNILYTFLKPSVGKVVAKIRTSIHHLSGNENRAFNYLKDFVKSLDADELEVFLQFVTGHRTIPIHPIIVEFVDLSGVQRRPIAHTCGNVLELPHTYDSYEEFQTEFRNLLLSDEAMRMDMK